MREPWRYACPDCGSVNVSSRTCKGGYRCRECYATFDEPIDKKRQAVR